MGVVGITAEYNPFHSGHLYQLQHIRCVLGEDTPIVAVMSGDFVQRGSPSPRAWRQPPEYKHITQLPLGFFT